MTITSSNIPLHACNGHVTGHEMDVITCITWWSLPLQSHYIQDVIHVITCPLHAPKDANEIDLCFHVWYQPFLQGVCSPNRSFLAKFQYHQRYRENSSWLRQIILDCFYVSCSQPGIRAFLVESHIQTGENLDWPFCDLWASVKAFFQHLATPARKGSE